MTKTNVVYIGEWIFKNRNKINNRTTKLLPVGSEVRFVVTMFAKTMRDLWIEWEKIYPLAHKNATSSGKRIMIDIGGLCPYCPISPFYDKRVKSGFIQLKREITARIESTDDLFELSVLTYIAIRYRILVLSEYHLVLKKNGRLLQDKAQAFLLKTYNLNNFLNSHTQKILSLAQNIWFMYDADEIMTILPIPICDPQGYLPPSHSASAWN